MSSQGASFSRTGLASFHPAGKRTGPGPMKQALFRNHPSYFVCQCFIDWRRPESGRASLPTLVGQRVFGIALGYEDINDHDELRHDPVLAVLAGKLVARRRACAPVAGKSTLNRLELSRDVTTRYHKIAHDPAAIEGCLSRCSWRRTRRRPEIILDLDATDDPLHGHQEGRFFHGYYDCYCYLPLYIFCGRHLLAAKLRPANIDASAGAVEEPRDRAQIRARWPTHTHHSARRLRVLPRRADDAGVKPMGRLHLRAGQERPA